MHVHAMRNYALDACAHHARLCTECICTGMCNHASDACAWMHNYALDAFARHARVRIIDTCARWRGRSTGHSRACCKGVPRRHHIHTLAGAQAVAAVEAAAQSLPPGQNSCCIAASCRAAASRRRIRARRRTAAAAAAAAAAADGGRDGGGGDGLAGRLPAQHGAVATQEDAAQVRSMPRPAPPLPSAAMAERGRTGARGAVSSRCARSRPCRRCVASRRAAGALLWLQARDLLVTPHTAVRSNFARRWGFSPTVLWDVRLPLHVVQEAHPVQDVGSSARWANRLSRAQTALKLLLLWCSKPTASWPGISGVAIKVIMLDKPPKQKAPTAGPTAPTPASAAPTPVSTAHAKS
eukprot:363939-Chlamydomonas_euryale.AAC.4